MKKHLLITINSGKGYLITNLRNVFELSISRMYIQTLGIDDSFLDRPDELETINQIRYIISDRRFAIDKMSLYFSLNSYFINALVI